MLQKKYDQIHNTDPGNESVLQRLILFAITWKTVYKCQLV